MRNLIQVIVTIVSDLRSFIVIIGLIIVGFSFVFLVFSRGSHYGNYLYTSYGSLYGPVDDSDTSPSEKFFIALIAFLLNVVLLNLLISIMGDSYSKVLDKRIKTDLLTRLDMISEAITLLKFLGCKEEEKDGFLVFCLSVDVADDEEDEDDDTQENETEEKAKFLRQNEEVNEKGNIKLESALTIKLEKQRRILEEKIERVKVEQNEKLEEKTNKILSQLTEVKEYQRNQQRAAAQK